MNNFTDKFKENKISDDEDETWLEFFYFYKFEIGSNLKLGDICHIIFEGRNIAKIYSTLATCSCRDL